MAKNARNTKSATSSKPEAGEFDHLVGFTATISDKCRKKIGEGRSEKPVKGMTCKVMKTGKSKRYGTDYALVMIGDETLSVQPHHLTKGKPFPEAELIAFEESQKEEREARIILPAVATAESGGGVLLRYVNSFVGVWFPKKETNHVGEFDADTDLYEVPLWIVRRRFGAETVDALLEKQNAYSKMVNTK